MFTNQIAIILIIMLLVAVSVVVFTRVFRFNAGGRIQFGVSCALVAGIALAMFNLSLNGMVMLFS